MAAMTETQQKLLDAHTVLALAQELSRRPTDEKVGLLLRVLSKAIVGSAMPRSQRHPRLSSQPQKGERLC